jgi:hypothetical protein
MTKLIASLSVLAVLAVALPAQACPLSDQTTAQSTPVVTSDAGDTAPMTPVPTTTTTTPTTPTTTTAPKTGS